MTNENNHQWALVFSDIDNIILNNYWRRFYTYKEVGWDDESITEYLSKKENIMKIASFNTSYVSFSASSRRNRYYEVYNRDDMMDQDVQFDRSIEGLRKLNSLYEIFLLTSRKESIKEKTLQVMERLGFDLSILNIHFLPENKKLFHFRSECMKEITKKYPTGVGICLNPNEKIVFDRYGYTPIGFTSIKDYGDFQECDNPFSVICQDWTQILTSLNVIHVNVEAK